MALTHAQAKRYYDRFGKLMNTQAFYEDASQTILIEHAGFDRATTVFELGCGTGRFAARLFEGPLPPTATYVGVDLSETMVRLAHEQLAPWQARAQVLLSDGAMRFPLPDHTASHFVSTYVFELLPEADVRAALAEARRVLAPGGKLCLLVLTQGKTAASRALCTVWEGLYRLHAPLVGGCHPLVLNALFDPAEWRIEYNTVVTQYAVPSQVLIASPIFAD